MIKLLRFLKPYKVLLIVIFILAVGQVSANLYCRIDADIVNNGIAAFNTNYIWQTGGLMVIVAIGGTICAVIGIYLHLVSQQE